MPKKQNYMKPKKENRGGANRGQGRKSMPDEEKVFPVAFQIKKKHRDEARKIIQPIVDEINKS